MSEDPVPSTLAPFIVRKLDALGSDLREADLDALNELLYTVPEERVVSDEEVQELKNLEKKTLENQDKYKKETENMNKRAKFQTRFFMLFPLPVFLSIFLYAVIPEFEPVGNFIMLFRLWPFKSVAVGILFYLYGFDLGFKIGTPEPEVLENEDDDWQDTMTSTELHSRQKALVNGWEQLQRERVERILSKILPRFALVINLVYSLFFVYFIHWAMEEQSMSFFTSSLLTDPVLIFFFIEYMFSISLFLFFFIHFLVDGPIDRD